MLPTAAADRQETGEVTVTLATASRTRRRTRNDMGWRLLLRMTVAAVAAALMVAAVPSPDATAASARPRITLAQLKPVVAGTTYSVSGRVSGTGARDDKTILLQSRTAGGWRTAATKKWQDDGAFRFRLTAPSPGQRTFRAVVRRGGRTLAVTAGRNLSVLPATQVNSPRARPGEAGPASNFTTSADRQSMREFLSYVLADVQRFWDRVWAQYNLPAPTFNYYWPVPGEAFHHACRPVGTYVDDAAAHYCPANDYIVINTALAAHVWQAAGDFAVAMVVAHEYAHNLQHELRLDRAGLADRSYELHADCWAGTWANSAYYQGILEAGDIEEAVLAAGMAGDVGGPNDHGTSAQRQTAFLAGYNSGQPTDCNSYLR